MRADRVDRARRMVFAQLAMLALLAGACRNWDSVGQRDVAAEGSTIDIPALDSPTDTTSDGGLDAVATDTVADTFDVFADTPADVVCMTGETACRGACVNLLTSVGNCGACGNTCTGVDHSTPACVGGMCVALCMAGFADCDRAYANGCEVSITDSVTHCGACGVTCPAGANEIATCTMSVCGRRCATNTGDCNMSPIDGCEIDLQTTPAHCGACGTACPTRAHATSTCSSRMCGFSCDPGFADCDGMASTGCEADLSVNGNCGRCGLTCTAPTGVCTGSGSSAVCSSGCMSPTPTSCGGVCVNTSTNPAHCGMCGNACASFPNSTPICASGSCDIACDPSFGDCDGARANGCETDTRISTLHCGRCGGACAAPTGGTARCLSGVCTFDCMPGLERVGMACLPIAPPRLIAPMSATVVGARRPALQYALESRAGFATPTGARIQLCRDRACTMVDETLTVLGAGPAMPSTSLSGRMYYWRAAGRVGSNDGTVFSPTWEFFLPNGGDGAATSWGSGIHTIDADRYGDLVVAAPDAGEFYLYRGNAAGGLDATPIRHALTGTASPPRPVVAVVGDATGGTGPLPTGTADVLVGAPGLNQAFLFAGESLTTAGAMPTRTFNAPMGSSAYGSVVANGGDANGDGLMDLLIADPAADVVHWFESAAAGAAPTQLPPHPSVPAGGGSRGTCLASAGDLNGDGFTDVIVGEPGGTRLLAYLWDPSMSRWTGPTSSAPSSPTASFGTSCASAGDLNGDGYSDVIVGAPAAHLAFLFLGGTMGLAPAPAFTFTPADTSGTYGAAVAGNCDVNADGTTDVLIGDPRRTRVDLWLGTRGGSPTLRAPYTDAAMEFGASVSCALSVLTPGYADVAIGAPGSPGGNAAFVTFTSPGSPPPVTLRGPAPASRFGASLADLFVPARAAPRGPAFLATFPTYGVSVLVPGA